LHSEGAWIWLEGPDVDRGYCTHTCSSNADCETGACDRGDRLCLPPSNFSPIQPAEILPLVVHQEPAPIEIAAWVAGGGGVRLEPHTRAVATLGAGVESTFPVADLGPRDSGYRLPDEPPRPWHDPAWVPTHLRAGPWLAIESTIESVRGEGGLSLDLGGWRAASFSSFRLRGGAGGGSEGSLYAVGELSWGVRYAEMRKTENFPEKCPALVAPVAGLRVFTAVRQELRAPYALELTMGIEWEPLSRGLGFDPRPAW
jgi:hypothetical protein